MSGRVWRSALFSLGAIAVIVTGWMGVSRLGYTRAYFSDTVKTSAVFKVGSWQVTPLLAYVDIEPKSLQKKSKGDPITVFIGLPEGYDVRNIDTSSLGLSLAGVGGSAVGPSGKSMVVGSDGNGASKLKVTFDRAKVIALVKDIVPPINIIFSVSGTLATNSGASKFSGTDLVTLVDPPGKKEPIPEETITPTGTVTVTATLTTTTTPGTRTTATPTTTVGPEETIEPEETVIPSGTPSPATPESPATDVPGETAVPTETPASMETPIPTETAVSPETPVSTDGEATAAEAMIVVPRSEEDAS